MGQRSQKEIEKYLDTNDNGNTTFQNLWDTAKTFKKFIAMNAYTNKKESSEPNVT
jgi:hypothetical protein